MNIVKSDAYSCDDNELISLLKDRFFNHLQLLSNKRVGNVFSFADGNSSKYNSKSHKLNFAFSDSDLYAQGINCDDRLRFADNILINLFYPLLTWEISRLIFIDLCKNNLNELVHSKESVRDVLKKYKPMNKGNKYLLNGNANRILNANNSSSSYSILNRSINKKLDINSDDSIIVILNDLILVNIFNVDFYKIDGHFHIRYSWSANDYLNNVNRFFIIDKNNKVLTNG